MANGKKIQIHAFDKDGEIIVIPEVPVSGVAALSELDRLHMIDGGPLREIIEAELKQHAPAFDNHLTFYRAYSRHGVHITTDAERGAKR